MAVVNKITSLTVDSNGNPVVAATTGPGFTATGGTNATGLVGNGNGTGNGVEGISTNGYGVWIQSDTTSPVKAALRFVPQDAEPTGAHLVGDQYTTTAGDNHVVRVAGTPGTFRHIAAPRVQPKGADFTINATTDQNCIFTNENASAQITATLPAASPGLIYRFVSVGSFNFVVSRSGSNVIFGPTGIVNTISMNDITDSVTLIAINTGVWSVIAHVGTLV